MSIQKFDTQTIIAAAIHVVNERHPGRALAPSIEVAELLESVDRRDAADHVRRLNGIAASGEP